MTRDFARQLRREMTDAERMLWKSLRARRFEGVEFRRQELIGRYIVDFVSHETRLIIELDGGQHTTQAAYDADRTQWLNSRGYRVIRFWNDQVLTETEPVLESIALALAAPLPNPPPRGGEGTRQGLIAAQGSVRLAFAERSILQSTLLASCGGRVFFNSCPLAVEGVLRPFPSLLAEEAVLAWFKNANSRVTSILANSHTSYDQ
jgi:very-short-patch-repair endonuclease